MSLKIYTDLDLLNATRITNLPAPSSANDAARKADIDAAIEGIKQKDPCVVSTQGNLNLSSPGSTIDGVTMVSGDRFLARAQSTASQNGIYIFNGPSTAATRSADCSTAAEITGALTEVVGGTNASQWWRQTATVATIDSSTVTWAQFGTSAAQATEEAAGVAELATQAEADAGVDDSKIITPLKLNTWSGRSRKVTSTFGDGSTTQFDISHNFATRAVECQVYRVASPYDNIMCDISRPDTNTVRLNFTVAPTSNQFTAVVIG
jgi:hypothetical protein